MGFDFYIDGTLVEEPDGWLDFREDIVRDNDKRTIRIDYPISLNFCGLAYDIIEAKYQESYDNELELKVVDRRTSEAKTIVQAIIKLSNCTWNLTKLPKKQVTAEIDDTIYQSRIFARWKSPFDIGSNKTLNGFDLTPITPIDMTVFSVAAGVNEPDTRQMYDVKEAFRYAISFISDNAVSFESDWYDSLPDDEKIALCVGIELRDPTRSDNPTAKTNLQVLFEEIYRKYNLWFICENDVINPTVRLETADYLAGDTIAKVFDPVEGLTRSLDFELLYNRIRVGSTNAIQEFGTNFSFFYIPFLAFVEEEYNLTSLIGVDRELDLTSTYIIDNNVIANTIENNDDTNDDEIFIIQYTASTSTATKWAGFPSIDPNNRFYNEQLTNSAVVQRYDLLGDLVLNSGLLESEFQAGQTTPIVNSGNSLFTVVTIIDTDTYVFDDDSTPPNFDEGNNYDNTTYEYTAPVSGAYRFRVTVEAKIANFTSADNIFFNFVLGFFKNGTDEIIPNEQFGTFIDTFGSDDYPTIQKANTEATISDWSQGNNTGRRVFVEQTIVLNAGDTLSGKVLFKIRNSEANIGVYETTLQNGIFTNPSTPLTGGTYQEKNQDDYFVGLYNLEECHINDKEWEYLKGNLTSKLILNTGENDPRISYANNISRNIVTGETDCETIFNRNQKFK